MDMQVLPGDQDSPNITRAHSAQMDLRETAKGLVGSR